MLDLSFINYKTFSKMFELLQEFEYINKSLKLNQQWELVKEKLKKINLVRREIFQNDDIPF